MESSLRAAWAVAAVCRSKVSYCLAQLNIARFRLPADHPQNADFINNLDRINDIAERQDGFIWRLIESQGDAPSNNALAVSAYDDPNIIVNISLWRSVESLSAFVYRNKEHRAFMRRGSEWFDKLEFSVVLWWVKSGHTPSIEEAKDKLKTLSVHGPSENAFTFKDSFPRPD